MPRKAATRSCSAISSPPVAASSAWAGDVVPQNGQTSSFLAGFHCASPPQDGHENFLLAVADLMMGGWSDMFGFSFSRDHFCQHHCAFVSLRL
jgi:hypothetical protein